MKGMQNTEFRSQNPSAKIVNVVGFAFLLNYEF